MPQAVQPITRMVLIRHGEPEESFRGRCYGRLDPGLSLSGAAQMREMRHRLQGLSPLTVYSSPRRRALEAARLIAAEADVVTDARLGEIDFGCWEGLTYDEIATRYPDLYRQWMRHPTRVAVPGGESFQTMRERVRRALADIRRANRGEWIAVVSHGGVNRIALADALGMPASQMFRLDQAYACMNVIDFVGDEPFVRAINVQSGGGRPC